MILYSFHEVSGDHCSFAEYCQGGSLYDYLHVKENHLELDQGLLWASQIAEGTK